MYPYDAFETKADAKELQTRLKKDETHPVQHVHIRKTIGRLKWVVFIGGKNSRYW